MAQPNVVREPSMDEILASIRRIIESNEPVTQAGVATAMAEPEGFSGRPANDDSEEVTLTVDDAFTARNDDYAPISQSSSTMRAVADLESHAASSVVREMRQPNFAQPAFQPAPVPQKALSLADVAARVRAASERTSMVMRDMAASQPAAAEAPEPVVPETTADTSTIAVRPLDRSPVDAPQEFSTEAYAAPVETQRDEEDSYKPEPVSLLSSSVGEQVARSFQDLAFAVDNAERRSLDQIAEDMLRPMLQEWLDDNLPTLVERLVREEIERVARGPRR